ncbi:TIGR04133 family radical SAM/SPASM protein [Ancylomarina longa]|uniref:Radical SAM protein n=1 Tax=Ancylomarina longa TaxID=2487017 RepID=A0A434AVQ0_9BACT|nr:TIGR04133 family radical SAM/SPASM protein [Ancylomarina longa]RUT78456.1 radical SAM protein [Ancylomarina longa]
MIADIPLRKKIALELFRKYRHNAAKIHQLNYLFWECTLRCNLNCLHCGSDCKKEAVVKDMPVDDFIAAVDDVSDIVDPHQTMIVFTGGEPLVRQDLEICGQKLYDRGFPWGMVSNGMGLNEQRLQSLLQAGLRAVTISLDGMEAAHNWLRGNKNSFKNAVRAIELLAKIPDLKFDVVTCANQKNLKELGTLKSFLMEKGVSEWRIFTVFPIGRAKRYDDLQLTSIQFKSLFDFIKAERKSGGIQLNYGCEGFLGNYEGEVRDDLFFCRAGINVASVLVDGSISACPNLRANFTQGNIYQDSLKDCWQNRYDKFRDRSWTKKGVCASCDYFRYCEGNGLHLRDEKNEDLLFCHFKRIQEGENSINT